MDFKVHDEVISAERELVEVTVRVDECYRGGIESGRALTIQLNLYGLGDRGRDAILRALASLQTDQGQKIWLMNRYFGRKTSRAASDLADPDSDSGKRNSWHASWLHRETYNWTASRKLNLMSMQNCFQPFEKDQELLQAVRIACEQRQELAAGWGRYTIPLNHMQIPAGMPRGDANSLELIAGKLLERVALQQIKEPRNFLAGKPPGSHLDDYLADIRVEGIKTLKHFRSQPNIELLKQLLSDRATREVNRRTPVQAEKPSESHALKEYIVRREAYRMLVNWGVEVERPKLIKSD